MRLLTSQKDTLYDIIQEYGLSPAQFEFSEKNKSSFSSSSVVTGLHYKNSDFVFRFDTLNNEHYCSFCPGNDSYNEEAYPGTWDLELTHFQTWINNLLREINSPNKWDRLQKEMAGIKISFGDEQDKFSVHEYEDLKAKILTLKQGIAKIGFLPDQAMAINAKLDHLTDLAKDLNKFDWKSLFVGTIISVIIQLSVTQENAGLLWRLIKQIFSSYFLP
jgi:hypothetical protein